jgi:hypothetical protein
VPSRQPRMPPPQNGHNRGRRCPSLVGIGCPEVTASRPTTLEMLEAPMGQTRQTPHRYAYHGVPYVTSSKAPCGNFVPCVIDAWHAFCSHCPTIVHTRITIMHAWPRELLRACATDLSSEANTHRYKFSVRSPLGSNLISQRSHSNPRFRAASLCK